MNQILLTENYKKDKKPNRNNSGDMKKIIIFFSIAICVFAVVIIGLYGYKLYNNKNKKEKVIEKPQLALEETEDSVTIIAKAEAGINKIIYTWNEEEPIEIDMNGRTNHEEQMDIPSGYNTLNVKVIDENGDEIESTKDFEKVSTQGPVIEINAISETELQIRVTDETALDYITYNWDDEEPTRIEAMTGTETLIEKTIDIRDNQKITVAAVDSDGNEEQASKSCKIYKRPGIVVTKRGDELYMKITHEKGFERVEFCVNGQIYKYNEDYQLYDPEQKELEYKFKMIEGRNTVVILAVSIDGTEKIYTGECEYIPEQ